GAEQVSGILDNTDIFEIITRAGYTYNTAPQVDAGEDQLIEDGTSATLTGIVVDDGLSEPLGTVTAAWSKTSGPGTVQFADASAASTSAQFSAIGTYVLTLSADDGLLTGTDQIEITVAIRTSCGVGEPETDSDGDSTPDCIDACPDDALKIEPGVCGCGVTETALDSDNDGLADCVDADDDNDSVSDAQEYLDHTDPFDRGSNLVLLPATVCAEWNGFLGGMWNIMEHINLSHAALAVSSTLYDMNDLPDGSRVFSVPTGGQTDLIVHDMPGFEPNRYGKVCSSVNSAQPGDFDGRMVYYKPSPGSGTANTFDFAFAMPFLSGVKGRQFVLFNTFQPSLDSGDRRHRVANWIQLTNLSDHAQSGDLVFYSQSGAFLGSEETDLLAGARKDFS
ncbi:MAG TPA: hypothetical protein PLP17_15980, partial [Oligoflexia bacterium]|nr:hypothetical protein [Oligoflexia bacterium]